MYFLGNNIKHPKFIQRRQLLKIIIKWKRANIFKNRRRTSVTRACLPALVEVPDCLVDWDDFVDWKGSMKLFVVHYCCSNLIGTPCAEKVLGRVEL